MAVDPIKTMKAGKARVVKTNPRTGLKEGYDEHFRVPLVYQRSVGGTRFAGQPTAVHTVPYREGKTLDFFSRLNKSDEIVVTFHGANSRDKNRYPMFARIASLRLKAPAMMSFADPTLLADSDRDMLLAWYLGGSGWDPLPTIISVVRNAMRKAGAKHIAFIGGSGGGYAALRASAMVPGSLALVSDPQTNLARYIPHVVERYFRVCWPDWDQAALVEGFPERFDMALHYRDSSPENFVYYTQNRTDVTHVKSHLIPLQSVSGVKDLGESFRGPRRVFEVYDGELSGHGKITATEFDKFYEDAFTQWRSYRRNILGAE